METLASTPTCSHARIALTTSKPTEFIDLTARIQSLVTNSGIDVGFVNIQTLHTTTAIVVNEGEPLLLSDFATLLEQAAPRDRHYRHDDLLARTVNITAGERVNGHAHCRALLLPSSACLNVCGGTLMLGTWQRVFFVELDGPRVRHVSVLVAGEGRR
ncbi:MAG TPA: secondary thiamine-phosphate synthase enzyme YjbQ [Vicinamibacterales bacterium]|jgi:secondary thiamine-phosphate synthase enzyme